MTTVNIGDTNAALSKNERLARATLQLLRCSAICAPADTDDLGVWLAVNAERHIMLSGGERVLWDLALAIYNGQKIACLDTSQLDDRNRAAVGAIVAEWLAA